MAEKEKQKRKVYTTPKGEATLCYLVEPSDKFNKDGVYSVRLALDKAQADELINTLMPEYDTALEAAKTKYDNEKPAVKARNPFKENLFYTDELDEGGNATGRILFNFKMTASGISQKTNKPWTRQPALFDAQAEPIKRTADLKIWGGSIVKVSFTLNPYYVATTGCGISLCLEAAQVLKASGGERSATTYGFGAEEGYEGVASASPSADVVEGEEGETDF